MDWANVAMALLVIGLLAAQFHRTRAVLLIRRRWSPWPTYRFL